MTTGIIIAAAGNEAWSQNSTSVTKSKKHDDDENNDFCNYETVTAGHSATSALAPPLLSVCDGLLALGLRTLKAECYKLAYSCPGTAGAANEISKEEG